MFKMIFNKKAKQAQPVEIQIEDFTRQLLRENEKKMQALKNFQENFQKPIDNPAYL